MEQDKTSQMSLSELNETIQEQAAWIDLLRTEIAKVVIGNKLILDRLLVGLLSNGHILLEGMPGLAKTLLIKTLAQLFKLKFQRVQFTPDLLPADIVGTLIYNPTAEEFKTKKGPIFTNILLADEINRSPSKVQSALLEAMQERQVTLGETTYPLDNPFLVLATQNPVEQEGTYPCLKRNWTASCLKLQPITPPGTKNDKSSTSRPLPKKRRRPKHAFLRTSLYKVANGLIKSTWTTKSAITLLILFTQPGRRKNTTCRLKN